MHKHFDCLYSSKKMASIEKCVYFACARACKMKINGADATVQWIRSPCLAASLSEQLYSSTLTWNRKGCGEKQHVAPKIISKPDNVCLSRKHLFQKRTRQSSNDKRVQLNNSDTYPSSWNQNGPPWFYVYLSETVIKMGNLVFMYVTGGGLISAFIFQCTARQMMGMISFFPPYLLQGWNRLPVSLI